MSVFPLVNLHQDPDQKPCTSLAIVSAPFPSFSRQTYSSSISIQACNTTLALCISLNHCVLPEDSPNSNTKVILSCSWNLSMCGNKVWRGGTRAVHSQEFHADLRAVMILHYVRKAFLELFSSRNVLRGQGPCLSDLFLCLLSLTYNSMWRDFVHAWRELGIWSHSTEGAERWQTQHHPGRV